MIYLLLVLISSIFSVILHKAIIVSAILLMENEEILQQLSNIL